MGDFWYNVYGIILLRCTMKTKKQLILLILKVLETKSDKNNPITQLAIAEYISAISPCDRKTVGRNIKFLIDMNYPIVKTGKGVYLDTKKYSVEEVDYIIEAIDKAPNASKINKDELKDKLLVTLNQIYRS